MTSILRQTQEGRNLIAAALKNAGIDSTQAYVARQSRKKPPTLSFK